MALEDFCLGGDGALTICGEGYWAGANDFRAEADLTAFPVDALRFAVVHGATPGQDQRFGPAKLDNARKVEVREGGVAIVPVTGPAPGYPHGSDPAAVAFDTLAAAKTRNADVAIIDTAGRLHTKGGLMDELSKIKRVMDRQVAAAPHEVLLVLDASTGQNALRQAEEFTKSVDVTGLVLTKLDGTAKGGIVIGISNEFKIPVKYIGVGEKIDDLQVFDRRRFVEALFG